MSRVDQLLAGVDTSAELESSATLPESSPDRRRIGGGLLPSVRPAPGPHLRPLLLSNKSAASLPAPRSIPTECISHGPLTLEGKARAVKSHLQE